MRITNVSIQNFIGARSVDVKLGNQVTLFAGSNGAGKSSIQEAVRMALTGESVRVALKKDYARLITEGAESGFAEVLGTDEGQDFTASIILPSGKGQHSTDSAVPYVLDAQRFAKLDLNERRAFLFGLMGLRTDGAEVKKRLMVRGCDEKKAEIIAPFLRAGFDVAQKEAQSKARDEKTAWRTITGETYGEKKAASWAAEKRAFNATELIDLQKRLSSSDAGLAAANQRIGALLADQKRYTEAAQRLAELREKGSRYARISDKLVRDETELKEWEAKVSALKGHIADKHAARNEPSKLTCPDCGSILMTHEGKLAHWYHEGVTRTISDNDEAKLPEYEKAMLLLQSTVANDKRDLAEADAAAKAVSELEATVGSAPDEAEINATREMLAELARKQQSLSVSVDQLRDAERQSKQADERTANALAAHKSVLAWSAISDALAPDGIPGEMLAEALDPINDRLEKSSEVAEWLHAHIEPDMSIYAAYPGLPPRPYALLSESEKWRTDAMIAEAISYLSGVKLLVLDRFDVLDMKGREDLLIWLDTLTQEGDVDTAMIFGTLKSIPTQLPNSIGAWWIANGVAGFVKSENIKEAA